MNIFPYSLIFFSFPLNICFAPRLIRSGGHTVGITSSSCYTGQYFYLPPCRRSFGAGLFIFHLFAVIITLSTIIFTAYLPLRSAVPGQRPEYIFASDSVRLQSSRLSRSIAAHCGSLLTLTLFHFLSVPPRRTSFSFSQRTSQKRNQSPSRGDRLSHKVAAEPLAPTTTTSPSRLSHLGKFIERQWISRPGLNISPSQVTTCALPILFAVRFRSH